MLILKIVLITIIIYQLFIFAVFNIVKDIDNATCIFCPIGCLIACIARLIRYYKAPKPFEMIDKPSVPKGKFR